MVRPVVLIIMDGWGIAPAGPGNAIAMAKTPNLDRLWAAYPKTQLLASGEAVGLPQGAQGNSETGHLNLGAGQVVFQDLPRIDMSIADGSFFQIPAFKAAARHARENSSSLHLIGLLGAGGVHSSLRHILALLHFAKDENINRLFFHFFIDGRDSPPTSATTYLAKVEAKTKALGCGRIATLCGRYFGMDRDYHWERTQKAYELMVSGKGAQAQSSAQAIQQAYQNGKTDEFIEPVVIDKKGLIKDNDAVIFFNFRIDRPRQLTKTFILPNFESLKIQKPVFDPYAEKYGHHQDDLPAETTTFKREKILKNLFFVTMTEYEPGLPVRIAFPPELVKMPLARVLAEKGLRQFRIAETEKERFITYYFDGQRESPFPGEDRLKIPSLRVATYDLKPEMSAREVTARLIEKIKTETYDFLAVNLANPDMVGHTGVMRAGMMACEVVDECVGKIVNVAYNLNGACVITADHGNVEEMINLQTGEIDTEHSTNPVPFIIVGKSFTQQATNLPQGVLADVAPTVLGLMGLEKPELMTGRNLLR